jgi:hypothetical protein
VCDELDASIRQMLVAQLRSTDLVIGPHADLATVRRDLRAINVLTVWTATYAGLLGHAELDPQLLSAVRRAATLVGDLGWALDALSDIHVDLEHRVWSLVWLELAELEGLGARWLIDPSGQPALALDALARSPIVDAILTRLGQQLTELERDPWLAERGAQLAALSRYMVWAFLQAEAPS